MANFSLFRSCIPLTLTAMETVIPGCHVVTATSIAMCFEWLDITATAGPSNHMTEKGSCGVSRVLRGLGTHQKIIHPTI